MTSQLMSQQTTAKEKPESHGVRPVGVGVRPVGVGVRSKTHGSHPVGSGAEPTVQEIIASARKRPNLPPARGAWIVSGLTAVLLWASFMPLDWSPLAWVALVPLLLLVRIPQRTRWMYVVVFCAGFATMAASLQWMRFGHVTMYSAWLLLAIYCGLYLPLFIGISRVAVHRLRVPFTVTVPVVWVGLEFVRANFLTGFAWYFLAHTQYRWLELIQISDLVGAYGVSSLLAMAAATVAGLLPVSVIRRLKIVEQKADAEPQSGGGMGRKQVVSVAASVMLFSAVLGYGYIRRSQADFKPGPRVALIQGNFVSEVKHDPAKAVEIFNKHRRMTGRAVRHQPVVIIWPETMFREPLVNIGKGTTDEDIVRLAKFNPQKIRIQEKRTKSMLADRSHEAGAAMIIGLEAFEVDSQSVRKYNSAVFITPDGGIVNRYDKMERVPFGEFIPLKERFPWLLRFTPFASGFGVNAGDGASVFEYKGYRGTPVICFEDTVPHHVRDILIATANADDEGRPADYLINLTNDGWFHGSEELDQHLITSLFRCVEFRTPMVRAVNTGISAVINGDGEVVEPDVFYDVDAREMASMRDPETGRWKKSLNAVLVHDVPLDNRSSLYLWWGDWFAGLCAAFCGLVVMIGWSLRRRDRRNAGRKLFEAAVKSPPASQ